MINETNVIIPAAGLGTRLGGDIPKCLVNIHGRTLLEWQLELLAGFDVVVTVVCGFKGELVKDLVRQKGLAVDLVMNEEFMSGGSADSVRLGVRQDIQSTVVLDGDLLVHPESIAHFFDQNNDFLVGWTKVRTSNPVFIRRNGNAVVEFSRTFSTLSEWSGPLRCPGEFASQMRTGHIFESLIECLPLPGQEVNCVEIDDAADLELAKLWIKKFL